MEDIALIEKYFTLNARQKEQFAALKELYLDWNSKINVISRKDTEHFYLHHVLHSLGITKVIDFPDGSRVMDVGTGGGFPGIPLAILFPNTEFLLVDSIGKKIKVVEAVCEAIGLVNVQAKHARVEDIKERFHFIVSRAVTAFPTFEMWVRGKLEKNQIHPDFKNGILYLKGGDISEEIKAYQKRCTIYPLPAYFEEDFFETKLLLYYR